MSRFVFSFPTTELSLRVADDIFGIVIDSQVIDRVEKHRLKVIVSELFVNAFLHGNRSDPKKFIEVVLEVGDAEFVVTVKDNGNGAPRKTLQALACSPVDANAENGRGMGIMHKFADKFDSYRASDGRFCVRVARKIKALPDKNEISARQA
jgi:anti-sigma regulatory factor (Ser/Thr protein kinase)